MKLYDSAVEALSSHQDEKVTDAELKMIQKKSGTKAMIICFSIFSVIILIAIIYTFVEEKEFPIFYILVFIFLCLPMTINSLRNKEMYACYGTVTDKTVRCAKLHKSHVYLPFEETKEIGTYKHKYTLSETVCEYYYCTVEINGKIYDNVCCYKKDFKKINVGDRVLISNNIGFCPVVYKCSGETEISRAENKI